ncbi:MAG: hypothetical protein ACREEW_16070, partial [Caulobacteraceae bacterium]
TLMTAYARQLRGEATFKPNADGGMTVRLAFPLPEGGPGPSGADREDGPKSETPARPSSAAVSPAAAR